MYITANSGAQLQVATPMGLARGSPAGNWLWKDLVGAPSLSTIVGTAPALISLTVVKFGATVSSGGTLPDHERASTGDVVCCLSGKRGTHAQFAAAGADLRLRNSKTGPGIVTLGAPRTKSALVVVEGRKYRVGIPCQLWSRGTRKGVTAACQHRK
jgi:hypothetical protein